MNTRKHTFATLRISFIMATDADSSSNHPFTKVRPRFFTNAFMTSASPLLYRRSSRHRARASLCYDEAKTHVHVFHPRPSPIDADRERESLKRNKTPENVRACRPTDRLQHTRSRSVITRMGGGRGGGGEREFCTRNALLVR